MTGVSTRSRRAAAVAVPLLLAIVLQVAASPPAEAATRRRDRMLSLTNGDRHDRDRTVLALNAKLSRYAERHSRQMAKKGYLFHTEDLAAKLRGLDWSLGGENVGVGSSLDGLERAFMKSKAHRRNVLRKAFDNVAIGIVKDDDRFWVTLIFYG